MATPIRAFEDPNLVPLSMLSRRLAALTGGMAPGYSRALTAAQSGTLPVVRLGGRWFVPTSELRKAAAVLGMSPPA